MDNTINNDIIEKTTIKRVAIYKAIGMLPPIETKDLWEEKNSIEHQKNYENKNVSETNDTMKNTKMSSTQNDWIDITNPKLKKKMRQKRYYDTHKSEIKNYYQKNKDKIKTRRKEYLESNRDKELLRKKNYRLKNKTNQQYKLSINLRNRLNCALKNNFKSGSAVKDLGCSIEQLKKYLESKFQIGMTWDNYGLHGWHIDHIKPLSSFDLSDRSQLLEACHYTNLQPLWAIDNLVKGDGLA